MNRDKISQDELWDGLHGVVSNHSQMKAQDILKNYRGLWQIEAAFRVNKHDLKMRPIFHWNPRRIRSHILICFIAYAIMSYTKYELKKNKISLSFEEIRDELNRVQESVVYDEQTKTEFSLPSKITSHQRSIYKALNISLTDTTKII